MLGVGHEGDHLLAGDFFLRGDLSSGLLDGAVDVACHPCRLDVRQDLRPPHEKVLARELLGDGVAKSSDRGCNHGGGR